MHRLPAEIHVPTSVLIAAMVAHGVVVKERVDEWERQRERAAAGWD